MHSGNSQNFVLAAIVIRIADNLSATRNMKRDGIVVDIKEIVITLQPSKTLMLNAEPSSLQRRRHPSQANSDVISGKIIYAV